MAGDQKDYVSWLHDQFCACQPCAAQRRDMTASHPRTVRAAPSGKRLGGKPGKSQRADDTAAYPLCRWHHGQAQKYEFSKPTSFFYGWDMKRFAAWEAEMGAKYYARYLEEQDALKNGTLPEEKLVRALRRRGFDPGDFAARFCTEYELGRQVQLYLARDLRRELKEGGVPL